jgi:hypothetical protein
MLLTMGWLALFNNAVPDCQMLLLCLLNKDACVQDLLFTVTKAMGCMLI